METVIYYGKGWKFVVPLYSMVKTELKLPSLKALKLNSLKQVLTKSDDHVTYRNWTVFVSFIGHSKTMDEG